MHFSHPLFLLCLLPSTFVLAAPAPGTFLLPPPLCSPTPSGTRVLFLPSFAALSQRGEEHPDVHLNHDVSKRSSDEPAKPAEVSPDVYFDYDYRKRSSDESDKPAEVNPDVYFDYDYRKRSSDEPAKRAEELPIV
ncbi:hypothetical protein MMC10_003306 [Thelotrema lepadinum]|nr:hypothetical protein [Thelotrema lepadinum]